MLFIIEDTDIASYADDKTPYVSANKIDGVIKSSEEASEILFKWFNQISELHKKASRKINALSTLASYLNMSNRCILMNAFFKSQFIYCPLVWMCHGCANNG